jgi:PAS domain-containing protein
MPQGGKAIEPGILQYVARGIRRAVDYFFGPDWPMPASAPPGTPPRITDYPVAYNIQIQPRDMEAISFGQMRSLADSFDIVRMCIETRKDQVSRMRWEFRLKQQPGEDNKARAQRSGKDKRIQTLTNFFQLPDKEHTWQQWVRLLMEDLLVLDAPAIVPIVSADGQLWSEGKSLYGLEVVDGSTIARKIDIMGRTPAAPAVAYQQIIKGLPAIDFTCDQLVYRPRNPRAHKFFGFGPVEQIILTINIAMRRQIHLLNYYTEGNIPEAIVQVPKEWSADQIAEYQQWFDSKLAGNSAMRRRVTFVPEAGAIQWTRDPKLQDELDEWLARVICYAFSISPQPFISEMNRATAETSVEQAAAEGLLPLLAYLADTINFMVARYFPETNGEIEFAWQPDRDSNLVEQAKVWDTLVRNGTLSIDEIREEMGKQAIGVANGIITAQGFVPLGNGVNAQPSAAAVQESEWEQKR